MGLSWTVLGGSPAWPNPGQAASGYVLEGEGQRVLVDCGSGIASELRAHDPGPLTAILISHFHADHWFDLVPLHYAYLYGSWHDRPHPSLHLPPAGRDVLDKVAQIWGGSLDTFEAAFPTSEFDPDAGLRIGSVDFSFAPCLHYTTCWSIKMRANGATIVYSADTAPTQTLIDFAAGADLFVCEASLADGSRDDADRGHMDPDEAAQAASAAEVGRLLLTHVPAENDHHRVLERAKAGFDGPVDVARPGLRFEV
jgi:ribonuclease BN (tRNA processing enzyme)